MQKLVPVVQIRSGEQRPAINGLVNSDGRLLAWYACPGPPSAKFQKHDCATHRQSAASLDPSSFTARARSLIMRGFKPKDAAEITMQEIIFEFRDDPDIARRVQIEAKDFLQRVKEGLI